MSGKWDDPAVPKTGWNCVGIEDLGAPDKICEMCEAQPIRYVHLMQHPDYRPPVTDALNCGCICAGNMERDPDAAREREDSFKSVAARRRSWSRRQWHASENGNSYVNVRGFNVVVFGTRKGYGVRISQRYGERSQWGKLRFSTKIEAQAAAFDALIWAERTWGGNGRYDL